MLSAAERNDALLVSLENVYAYGPTHGTPMTLPRHRADRKAQVEQASGQWVSDFADPKHHVDTILAHGRILSGT